MSRVPLALDTEPDALQVRMLCLVQRDSILSSSLGTTLIHTINMNKESSAIKKKN